jgi:hypothetical protein
MFNNGLFPPLPEELQETELKIEYISLLAQAQKMVGTRAVNELASFVGGLAGLNPEVLDKFDFDEAVDQIGSMVGVPPKLIRTDQEVEKIREGRAQAQAAAAQQQQQNMAIQNAKMLSDTPLNQDTALDAVSGLTGGEF